MSTLVGTIKKYKIGDGITDKELDTLIDFYTNANDSLMILRMADRAFHFPYIEVNKCLMELLEFRRSRSYDVRN